MRAEDVLALIVPAPIAQATSQGIAHQGKRRGARTLLRPTVTELSLQVHASPLVGVQTFGPGEALRLERAGVQ